MPGDGAQYARGVKAALAYVLLPVTGLIAYVTGVEARTRFHGLQAIVLGLVIPVALYVTALGPPVAVQIAFALGMGSWLAFIVMTAAGRDPKLPWLGSWLGRLAAVPIRDAPRSTSGS